MLSFDHFGGGSYQSKYIRKLKIYKNMQEYKAFEWPKVKDMPIDMLITRILTDGYHFHCTKLNLY